jgi:hypothetical protein
MTQQYRHIIVFNDNHLICNHRLFDVFAPESVDRKAFCAILNSTWCALTKHFIGRYQGREGALDTEVFEVKLLPISDPRKASKTVQKRLLGAFDKMRKRTIGPMLEARFAQAKRYAQIRDLENSPIELPEELWQKDRRQLDDAVFELIGAKKSKERAQLIERLYHEVALFNRRVRILELQAIENKIKAGRKASTSPQAIAAEIWDMLVAEGTVPKLRIPDDFVPIGAACDTVTLPEDGKARIIDEGFNGIQLKVGQKTVPLRHPAQAKLAQLLAQLKISGPVTLPIDRGDCDRMRESLNEHLDEWQKKFAELAGERTSNEDLAKKIEKHLWLSLLRHPFP